MRCYLFIEHAANGHDFRIRPIMWAAPDIMDQLTVPNYIQPTPDAMAWLAKYGCPTWIAGRTGSQMAKLLSEQLGGWPEPIEIDVQSIKEFPFNDDLSKVFGW